MQFVLHPPIKSLDLLDLICFLNYSLLYKFIVLGRQANDHLSSDLYKFDLLSRTWSKVYPMLGKPAQRQVMAHTAVYNKITGCIIVYGGFTSDSEK